MKRWLPLLFGVAACGSNAAEVLRVDVPIDGEHRAVVLAATTGGVMTVQASPISNERTIDPLQLEYTRNADIDVTALLYEHDLETLGLATGVLAEATDPNLAIPLPTAARIQQNLITAEAPTGWTTLDELPRDVDRFRIPGVEPCAKFETRVISLGTAPEPALTLAMDDRWALVTTNAQLLPGVEPTIFFVDGEQVVTQHGIGVSFFSGYRERGGRIWLGGERGAIYTATFTADPEPRITVAFSSTVSGGLDVIDLVGPPSSTVDERFALTTNREDTQWGDFEWYDNATWRTPLVRRNTPHDATWVEPGYALYASFFRTGEVFGIRDGLETSINVDSVIFGNVTVIEHVPGFGLVAATTGGEVHHERPGLGWRSIAANGSQEIRAVHGYEDGLVYVPGNELTQWVPGDVRCENMSYLEPRLEVTKKISVVQRDVVLPLRSLARGEDALGEQFIAWFARTE